MQPYVFIGAALLALLASLPALAFKEHWAVLRESWRGGVNGVLRDLVFGEVGVVTVAYYCRRAGISGSLTPPTAVQASQAMTISAAVEFSVVGDIASALITHNFGLDASAAQYFEPEIMVEPLSLGTTSWPSFTFWRSSPNVVQVNRPATDLPTTILVTLRRPHSIGQ